jgi:hypothetical protein
MTPEQLQRIATLDERLARKAELIRARQEKKDAKAGKKKKGPQPTQPTPAPPAFDPWEA